MNSLTPKQEMFVQNLIKGMSQREAYINSYNASQMKDNTIDNKASLLFKQDKIRARYDEVIKRLEDATIMDAKERMEWLTKVAKGDIKENYTHWDNGEQYNSEKEADLTTKIKAIDILNKMDGQYKTILGGNVGIVKLEDVL